jgi:hypothetical protein
MGLGGGFENIPHWMKRVGHYVFEDVDQGTSNTSSESNVMRLSKSIQIVLGIVIDSGKGGGGAKPTVE